MNAIKLSMMAIMAQVIDPIANFSSSNKYGYLEPDSCPCIFIKAEQPNIIDDNSRTSSNEINVKMEEGLKLH